MSRRLRELAHKAIHEVPIQEPAQPNDPVEPKAPVEEAEQFVIGVTDLSAIDSFPREDMVTRKTMTINHFIPGARQATQPLHSQSQTQAPLPPPPP